MKIIAINKRNIYRSNIIKAHDVKHPARRLDKSVDAEMTTSDFRNFHHDPKADQMNRLNVEAKLECGKIPTRNKRSPRFE
jgi:hypothetical protein